MNLLKSKENSMKKSKETFKIPERNKSHSKKRSKDKISLFLESEYLNKKRKQTNNIPQYLGDR